MRLDLLWGGERMGDGSGVFGADRMTNDQYAEKWRRAARAERELASLRFELERVRGHVSILSHWCGMLENGMCEIERLTDEPFTRDMALGYLRRLRERVPEQLEVSRLDVDELEEGAA